VGLKTILFAGVFAACVLAGLSAPIWALCGYILHYSTGPESQWWAAPVNQLGIRYAVTLVIAAAIGIALHRDALRFGPRLLSTAEWLMLGFLALAWLLTLFMPDTVGRYTVTDHPCVKLTKILVFVLMVTHVATTRKNLDTILWAMILGSLILGMEAYGTPRRAFSQGRLESVGGPDFADSNRLAGYMAAMLPIIGVMFLRSRFWGRLICFLAAGFVANTIVLCRSRGAVLGLGIAAIVAIFMMPRRYRTTLIAGVLVAGAGMFYLTDEQFLHRSATIARDESQRDSSAQSRIEIWQGGLKMLAANPLGVGPGNFYQSIGAYAPNHVGRDAHSTYVRCWGELGLPGIGLFLILLLLVVIGIPRRIMRQSGGLPEEEERYLNWTAIGLTAGAAAAFGYGITGTILYTEYAWWLLALPVCLERVLVNLREDLSLPHGVGALQEDAAGEMETRVS